MAEGILLSQATYDRIMKVVEAYERGELHVIAGDGLKVDEQGKDGTKISIDGTDCSQ